MDWQIGQKKHTSHNVILWCPQCFIEEKNCKGEVWKTCNKDIVDLKRKPTGMVTGMVLIACSDFSPDLTETIADLTLWKTMMQCAPDGVSLIYLNLINRMMKLAPITCCFTKPTSGYPRKTEKAGACSLGLFLPQCLYGPYKQWMTSVYHEVTNLWSISFLHTLYCSNRILEY